MLNGLRRLERFSLAAILLAMTAMFVVNVAIRSIGGSWVSQFVWIEEAVKWMGLFVAFGAIGLALERGRHIRMDLLDRHPSLITETLGPAIDIVGLLVSLYASYLSGRLAFLVLNTGQVSPTLNVSAGIIYLAPALGFASLAVRYGCRLLHRLKGNRK